MRLFEMTKAISLAAALLFSTLFCTGQDATPDQMAGKWIKKLANINVTFTIAPDLKYEVEFAGDETAEVWGSCEISGNQVTFHDKGGEYRAEEVPGIYEFKVYTDSLRLITVNDPVDGRRRLVEGKWSRAIEDEQ